MKIIHLILVVALFISYSALACERPAFVDTVLEPLKQINVKVIETFAKRPKHQNLCIYAATWHNPKPHTEDTGGGLEVYVATYTLDGLRLIAQKKYALGVDLVWNNPTIKIDPVNFTIGDKVEAFGIRISWGMLGGTFGSADEQFDLFVVNNGGLKSVLTIPISSSWSQRNCRNNELDIVRSPCEEDNVATKSILIVHSKIHNTYHDIVVKTTKTLEDPYGKRKQRIVKNTRTYIWNGNKYEPLVKQGGDAGPVFSHEILLSSPAGKKK